jgi:hypothetical protein
MTAGPTGGRSVGLPLNFITCVAAIIAIQFAFPF